MKHPFNIVIEPVASNILAPGGYIVRKQYTDGSGRSIALTGALGRAEALYTASVLAAALADTIEEEQEAPVPSDEILDALMVLRNHGCAAVAFLPEELAGACPDRVEDRLIEFGADVIECLKSA